MPRIGMNPSRGQVTGYKPARVTLAVLTYLPHDAGYFGQRFDVTRLCIESLIANTRPPFDLLVFDNGSSRQLVDYLVGLRDNGKIHYLMLSSQNIGKIGALQMIFREAPGEVVAYTDDDIFFVPGWLDVHLEILDTYPNVGMVTGLYLKDHVKESIQSTLEFAQRPEASAQRGNLIPHDWEQDYVDNTGRTWDRYQADIAGLEDILLCYHGVKAFASAGHHQFVARREVILRALPQGWSGKLMGQMREFDAAVDRLGYLRLSTAIKATHLIGNVVSERLAAEAARMGLQGIRAGEVNLPTTGIRRLLRTKTVHRFLQGLYNRLYWAINA